MNIKNKRKNMKKKNIKKKESEYEILQNIFIVYTKKKYNKYINYSITNMKYYIKYYQKKI